MMFPFTAHCHLKVFVNDLRETLTEPGMLLDEYDPDLGG